MEYLTKKDAILIPKIFYEQLKEKYGTLNLNDFEFLGYFNKHNLAWMLWDGFDEVRSEYRSFNDLYENNTVLSLIDYLVWLYEANGHTIDVIDYVKGKTVIFDPYNQVFYIIRSKYL